MTIEQKRTLALATLRRERECVSRECDRDCGNCELAEYRDTLLAGYDAAIESLEGLGALAGWLAKAVLSAEWHEDIDLYAELICRKLEKLGYLECRNEEYIRRGEEDDPKR